MANPRKSTPPLAAQPPVVRRAAVLQPGRSHGRPTQATVAAQAGVTTMTVSRYLRSPALVAPPTAARIDAALIETGYTPNKSAGLLAGRRSSIVAVIVPSIANSIFSETVQALSDGLQAHELELLLASTNYTLEREEQQIRAVLAWSPAALVVTGRRHTAAAMAMMHQAQADGTPVVEIWDCEASDREIVQIGFSHTLVGELMAQHLIGRGCRDLVYVDSAVPEDFRAHERGKAFAKAARAARVPVRVLQAPAMEPMAAGRAMLRQLLAQGGQQRLGMAFASDYPAAGAWLQAQDAGLLVPGRLSLLGFGDYPIAAQLGSGLSTVSVDRRGIGSVCARHLLASLLSPATEAVSPRQRVMLPRILQRGST